MELNNENSVQESSEDFNRLLSDDLEPITWDDDSECNFLFHTISEDDDCNLAFPRVPSQQVIYQKKKKCKMIGKYVMGDKLGEGSYGKVKEVLDSENLIRRAVKILKKKKLRKIPNGEQNVEREIQLHRGFNHENVIKLLDVLYDDQKEKMYIIMEYCVVGLQDMLNIAKGNKLPIWQAHGYFRQLIEGLQYLHSKGIIHKDIKPGNLLIALDETLKITDFGVAEALDIFAENDNIVTSQGTLTFQPPEVANGDEKISGYKVDIWSSGVTLYNITTGKYPFEGDNMFRLLNAIAEGTFTIPEELEGDICELIQGMMEKEPSERFTLRQIKNHSWVVRNHTKTLEHVPVTAIKGDEEHNITALPYLMDLYYKEDNDEYKDQNSIDDFEEDVVQKTKESDECLVYDSNNSINSRSEKDKRRNKTRWRDMSCINVNKFSGCKQS